MGLEVPVIFLEVTITTAIIDQEADLVIVEREVPYLNGGLQIQITNLIITMAEVKNFLEPAMFCHLAVLI